MNQRGFTLIELLVVIVIMATMIGTATFGFGRGESQRFLSEGQKMQAWLGQLQTESILTGSTWGAIFDEQNARAVIWSNNRWLETTDIESFSLKSGIKLSIPEALSQEESLVVQPHVMILPTGQMMPPSFINLSTDEASVNVSWLTSSISLEFQ